MPQHYLPTLSNIIFQPASPLTLVFLGSPEVSQPSPSPQTLTPSLRSPEELLQIQPNRMIFLRHRAIIPHPQFDLLWFQNSPIGMAMGDTW